MDEVQRVCVVGPLGPYAVGFAAELDRLGYTVFSARGQLRLAAHLSRWLAGEGLDASMLTPAVVAQFLVRPPCRRLHGPPVTEGVVAAAGLPARAGCGTAAGGPGAGGPGRGTAGAIPRLPGRRAGVGGTRPRAAMSISSGRSWSAGPPPTGSTWRVCRLRTWWASCSPSAASGHRRRTQRTVSALRSLLRFCHVQGSDWGFCWRRRSRRWPAGGPGCRGSWSPPRWQACWRRVIGHGGRSPRLRDDDHDGAPGAARRGGRRPGAGRHRLAPRGDHRCRQGPAPRPAAAARRRRRGDRRLSAPRPPPEAALDRRVFVRVQAPHRGLTTGRGHPGGVRRRAAGRAGPDHRAPAAAHRRHRRCCAPEPAGRGRAGAAAPPGADHRDLRQGRPRRAARCWPGPGQAGAS